MQTQRDAPLAPWTTLGLGGPAAELVTVAEEGETIAVVRAADAAGRRLLILGGGSNLVVPDAGVDAVVVRLASRGVEVDGTRVTAQAGEPWDALVARTVAADLAGMEALSGIPGSTGATPIQNVGAYGQEVAQSLHSVRVFDRAEQEVVTMTAAECAFSYRHSVFTGSERFVVLAVSFALTRAGGLSAPLRYAELASRLGVPVGERAPLAEVRATVLALRAGKGMVLDAADPDTRSVGSFFTNPVLSAAGFAELTERAHALLGPGAVVPGYPDDTGSVKTSAAWLIERAGFARGHGPGPVRLSTKHTLALTHPGGGTTAMLLALAREIRDGVELAFGVRLVNEPVLLDDEL